MFCPLDCHECHRPDCSRSCHLTGEAPLASCADCGELAAPTVTFRRIYICVACSGDGALDPGRSGSQ